jgi:hypothetical protein
LLYLVRFDLHYKAGISQSVSSFRHRIDEYALQAYRANLGLEVVHITDVDNMLLSERALKRQWSQFWAPLFSHRQIEMFKLPASEVVAFCSSPLTASLVDLSEVNDYARQRIAIRR